MGRALALVRTVVCIVSITRPEPRVYQPDPPGLMHDDPRLLPPWRGSSLLWGKKSPPGTVFSPSARALRRTNSPNSIAIFVLSVCAHLRLPPQIQLWRWSQIGVGPHGRGMTSTTHTGSTGSPGVLALLTDSELRNELERVAAAVGVRIVHAGVGSSVSRRTWSAAAAVVLDPAAADRYGRSGVPRRGHVSVLTAAEPTTETWAAAIAVGARHVLKLPAQERELIDELGEAAESARDEGPRGEVVAVIGGCGGAGASLLAAALA